MSRSNWPCPTSPPVLVAYVTTIILKWKPTLHSALLAHISHITKSVPGQSFSFRRRPCWWRWARSTCSTSLARWMQQSRKTTCRWWPSAGSCCTWQRGHHCKCSARSCRRCWRHRLCKSLRSCCRLGRCRTSHSSACSSPSSESSCLFQQWWAHFSINLQSIIDYYFVLFKWLGYTWNSRSWLNGKSQKDGQKAQRLDDNSLHIIINKQRQIGNVKHLIARRHQLWNNRNVNN